MYKYLKLLVVIGGIMFLLICGCIKPEPDKKSPTSKQKPSEVVPLPQIPKTLAIFPFENCAVTDHEDYDPLQNGLSAMLITDLKQCGTAFDIIEREKIQTLLGEIGRGQKGVVDQATAIQVGKMVGAQTSAFGSFVIIGNKVRIDTRIVRIETSEVVMAESITGNSDDFMELIRGLGKKIAASLNVTFRPRTPASEGDINAAIQFSRGLDALDKGDKEGADKFFTECIKLDPSYKTQVEKAKEAKESSENKESEDTSESEESI